jgi:hypothetical protein
VKRLNPVWLQNEPAGHFAQEEEPDTELNVLASQVTNKEEASGQYAPLGQSMHEFIKV